MTARVLGTGGCSSDLIGGAWLSGTNNGSGAALYSHFEVTAGIRLALVRGGALYCKGAAQNALNSILPPGDQRGRSAPPKRAQTKGPRPAGQ